MLLRFWGERGVDGDDFRHLVQEERGGIATTDLVTELRHRGVAARTIADSPDAVFRALGDGLPSILLLEGSPTLHYVVLVRADGDNVWVHDPNFGPERRLSRAELEERWRASGRWALVVAPSGQDTVATPQGRDSVARSEGRSKTGRGSATDTEEPVPADPDPSNRVGADQASRAPRSLTVDSAMDALRAGEHQAAREAALSLLGDPSQSAVGRRILATSFYLSGEEEAALTHWNALSDPRIDLVEIRGAQETRHHVLAHRLGLSPGTVLTARDLRIGRRRLSDIDALRRARVEYEPLADGDVEVRAFVQERPRWPGLRTGALRLAAAIVDLRASVEVGPLMASGDRWRAAGRWTDAQTFAVGEVSTASLRLPGIVSLALEWRRERFGGPGGDISTEERLRGSVGLHEWVTPAVRAEGRLGLERWTEDGRMASAGITAIWSTEEDGLRVTGSLDHWRGSARPFTRADLVVRGLRTMGDHADVRLSAFIDTARARDGLATGASRRLVDPGLGAFVDTGEDELRLDLARGEGEWVLSAWIRSGR